MGVNREALQLHAVYKKPYFLLQVTRESVSVLQVMWESVSGTASHAHCVWTCNEIEGSHDKIIITIAPRYISEKISLVCCCWHCYSCCALTTIQMATNSWYFPVQLRTMVIIIYYVHTYRKWKKYKRFSDMYTHTFPIYDLKLVYTASDGKLGGAWEQG